MYANQCIFIFIAIFVTQTVWKKADDAFCK